MANQVKTVPRRPKAGAGKEPEATKQIAFRAPLSLAARMEKTAARLGLDPSNFLRMLLLKHLPEHEHEADRIEGKE